MPSLDTLFAEWMAREPTASLLLAVVAALLFGVGFAAAPQRSAAAWAWARALLEALARALVFAGLLGMFYFILNTSYNAFSGIYGSFMTSGSLSNLAWQDWRKQ